MLAGDQLRQKTPFLLVGAGAPDLVDAEVGVRSIAQPDRGRGAAEFLHRHHMLEVAEARSAILLLDGNAVQSEVTHPGPEFAREPVGLVDLGGDRRHLGRGEALDLVAQRIGGLAQAEVERRHRIRDHLHLTC